jgi:hypothetical protein
MGKTWMLERCLWGGLFVTLLISIVAAAPTSPSFPTSQNASGTITTTNTFQSIWPVQSRAFCEIQNNGTHVMYVFFGPIVSATLATAKQVAAAASISCNSGLAVLYDQVSITGTSGDVFYANEQ